MNLYDQIASGEFNIWGRNAVVGTGLEEMYGYDQALDWNAVFAAAAALDFSSSSTADVLGGTGAEIIRVTGLDGNFLVQYEDITLNGQTKVVGTKTWKRVFGIEVIQAGSGKTNAGDIHCVKTTTGGTYTAGVPATLTSGAGKILVGWGATMNGMFTVPAGQQWELAKVLVSARTQAGTILIQVQDQAADAVLKTILPIEVAAGATEQIEIGLDISQRNDIRVRGLAAGASGIFSVVLKLNRKL